ncbi:MAG: hypothetical protein HW406_2144, partial [Candidatus Brocadiaceae bacterium]|nr:hypothetical protein [Candidatus Brocadiaceae bacterium]
PKFFCAIYVPKIFKHDGKNGEQGEYQQYHPCDLFKVGKYGIEKCAQPDKRHTRYEGNNNASHSHKHYHE